MQAHYKFEPDNRLCVYRVSGAVTAKGLLALFRAARNDEAWTADVRFLTVLENASLAHMDTQAINELMLGMQDESLGPKKRPRAAIVCNDQLSRGLLAFWVTASANLLGTQEKVFDTEEEARSWLTADEPVIPLPAR